MFSQRAWAIAAIAALVGGMFVWSSRAPAAASQIIMYDDFSGPVLNPTRWIPDAGKSAQAEQAYSPSNNVINKSGLHMVADKLPPNEYVSGGIASIGSFLYGHVDVVSRLPVGQGFYPAMWLRSYDNSGQMNGEIDLVEGFGSRPKAFQSTLHFWSHGSEIPPACALVGWVTPTICKHPTDLPQANYHARYHHYQVDWLPTRVTFRLDGIPYFTVTHGVPQVPMQLAISLAVGSGWDGYPNASTTFPGSLDVRSVTVTSL